jgi:hypothetical protein
MSTELSLMMLLLLLLSARCECGQYEYIGW